MAMDDLEQPDERPAAKPKKGAKGSDWARYHQQRKAETLAAMEPDQAMRRALNMLVALIGACRPASQPSEAVLTAYLELQRRCSEEAAGQGHAVELAELRDQVRILVDRVAGLESQLAAQEALRT